MTNIMQYNNFNRFKFKRSIPKKKFAIRLILK